MALPTNVQEHDQVSVINSLSKTEVEGIQEPEHDFRNQSMTSVNLPVKRLLPVKHPFPNH